ncbi:ABC transporter permease [Plantibacter sp. Mn2098]|uniref:ABC transporter permease n=1 Tax=Plantibacter sp. Mn2098 TaxID=3395266 RepID=UPI003BBB49BF
MPRLTLSRARLLLLPVLLIAEIVVFASLSPRFLTADNFANIVINASDLALIAAGLTLVIILGGIDVSTGYAVGVVAWIAAKLMSAGQPAIVVVLVSLVAGAVLGSINGLLTTVAKVPPIIATLGTAAVFQTALFALWNSNDLFATPVAPILSGQRFLGVPMVLAVVTIVYALLWWLSRKRRFGRNVYAIGSNPEAASLSGIRSRLVVFACYGILGLLVGLAATIYVGRVGVVQASTGNELTLLAIAAVVVGGTSILGGEGSVLRTLGGLAFIVVLQNGIVLAGVPPLWNGLIIGLTILLAVSVDVLAKRGDSRKLFRRLA